jgi:hypothetical protein
MATSYLEHTLAAADTNGNKKATFSAWLKRTNQGAEHVFYTVRQDSNNFFRFRFNSDQINVTSKTSGTDYYATTSAVFRDPSAFYHVVVAYDTTQGTASDRIKIYVNGEVQDISASNYPSQDATLFMIASGQPQRVGQESSGGYFDGIMAHVHYTEGYAYAASDFGSTDATSGIWKPNTSPSVSYGTNGFWLKFENSAAIGTDSSGASNDFTVYGNLTQNVDTPSNNQAILNNLYTIEYNSAQFFTNGNTTTNSNQTAWNTVPCTMAITKGRWYFEGYGHTNSSNYVHYGITSQAKMNANATQPEQEINAQSNGYAYSYYGYNGSIYYSTPSSSTSTSYGNTFGSTDYIGIFVDLEDNKIYFAKNGTLQNSGTGYDIHADGKPYLLTTAVYNGLTNLNFGSGVFGTTALTGTTYSDANSFGTFKYSPNQGGASNFDSTAKNFYTMNTKNLKQFGS